MGDWVLWGVERKKGGALRRVAGLEEGSVSSSGEVGQVLGASLRAVLRSACV